MTDEQWFGLLLLGGGVLVWFLVPRVVRQHHPDDPEAHTRRGPDVARVWSADERLAHTVRGRVVSGLFVVGGLLGLIAIVLGILGRKKAKRGEASNGGMALAGIVLGVLGLLLSVLVVAGGASFLGSEEGSNLTECLQDAGTDPAAQEQCRVQFEDQVGN